MERKSHLLPLKLPYSKLVAPGAATRSSACNPCSCSVCKIARTFPIQIQRAVLSSILSVGDDEEQPASPGVRVQCSKCLTYTGRGKAHKCNKTTRRSNLEELVKSSSSKTKGKVTSACLKAVFEEAGVTIKGGTTTLPTGCLPITVTVGPQAKPKKFSAANLIRLQTAYHFSDRTTM